MFQGELRGPLGDLPPYYTILVKLASQRRLAIPPTSYRGLSGPLGPSVPRECPRKGGCPTECPTGCPWGPFGPQTPGVQKVSRDSGDTLGTLFGHSGARGPKGPRHAPSDTPVFGDTPLDTRAQRGRETPVAGRRDRKRRHCIGFLVLCGVVHVSAVSLGYPSSVVITPQVHMRGRGASHPISSH